MSTCVTPYENERRRLRWMERTVAKRRAVSIEQSRELLGRAVRLTPDQQVNIRKRKPKDLYGSTKARINGLYIVLARKAVADLKREMALAAAAHRSVDPRLLAEAEAQIDALEQLIAEGRDGLPLGEAETL